MFSGWLRRLLVLGVAAVLLVARMSHAGFSPEIDHALRTAKELYVATERKGGVLSKVSPIWFMYDGQAVYFTTGPETWKAKRIRAGKPVHVWVGAADGPAFVTKAELSSDPALAERMGPVYAQKYWIAWLGLFQPRASRVREGKTLIVVVHPPA